MLYVFFGNDVIGVREAAWEKVRGEGGEVSDGQSGGGAPQEHFHFSSRSAPEKLGRASAASVQSAATEVIDTDNYEVGIVRDAAGAVSLFGEAPPVLIDATVASEDFLTELRNTAPALQESERTFVLILPKLLAADKKHYAKHAKEITEQSAIADKKLDVFALADALAKKDKKRLWLLYQELSREGVPAEELIGILWWQLKTLLLAQKTGSASEAGLKDFPYKKAKQALGNFSAGEIETLSLSLLTLYHQGHSGEVNIDEALELWLLSI